MKLLHIIATPRAHKSNTLRIATEVIAGLKAKYPGLEIQDLNLFLEDLPAVFGDIIEAKYMLMTQQQIDDHKRKSWTSVESRIEEFMGADIYVISTPMWNLGIPYALKFYIDTIVQPNYLFKYDQNGVPVPLVLNKKMICVSAHGGDYSPNTYLHKYDFVEPYLRAIFGYVGITDIQFINVQPMDITPEIREAKLQEASLEVAGIVAKI